MPDRKFGEVDMPACVMGNGPNRMGTTGISPGEVHIWCVRLDEADETIERARRHLSLSERQRAEQFDIPSARNRFVESRGVLRALLSALHKVHPEDLAFKYGVSGKPYLANSGLLPLHFNVSHSGNLAVYGATMSGELGVDIEMHRPMPDLASIARRFFAPAEYENLMQIRASERETAFFDCWVRKEAYVKACGGGLSIPLDSFWVSLGPGEAPALLGIREHSGNVREWSLKAFCPAPGYSGAIAVRSPECRARIHPITPAPEFLADTVSILSRQDSTITFHREEDVSGIKHGVARGV